MINKIRNKTKEIELRLAANQQMQEDHMALSQLLKMFDGTLFLPLTSWSISPSEVVHICNDIVINKREQIVEFGAGFSTICIAQLLKISHSKAIFISIENNPDWAAELNEILIRLELQDYVRIITAPITAVPKEFAKDAQEKWYDISIVQEAVSKMEAIDLVIVDGPYGGTTPYARYSAVPALKNRIAPKFAVFLDDANRDEEKNIANDWRSLLGSEMRNHVRYVCLTGKNDFNVAPYSVKPKI